MPIHLFSFGLVKIYHFIFTHKLIRLLLFHFPVIIITRLTESKEYPDYHIVVIIDPFGFTIRFFQLSVVGLIKKYCRVDYLGYSILTLIMFTILKWLLFDYQFQFILRFFRFICFLIPKFASRNTYFTVASRLVFFLLHNLKF